MLNFEKLTIAFFKKSSLCKLESSIPPKTMKFTFTLCNQRFQAPFVSHLCLLTTSVPKSSTYFRKLIRWDYLLCLDFCTIPMLSAYAPIGRNCVFLVSPFFIRLFFAVSHISPFPDICSNSSVSYGSSTSTRDTFGYDFFFYFS